MVFLAIEFGLEVGDFGSLAGALDTEEDAGAETGEGEDGENDDDGEEFVFRFLRFWRLWALGIVSGCGWSFWGGLRGDGLIVRNI